MSSWPCLHQWLETRPTRKLCPVCKAGISKETVVPLYGRGAQSADGSAPQDPREKVPPRPQGHRAEPVDTGVSAIVLDHFCEVFLDHKQVFDSHLIIIAN